jgi:hypothetical protein
MITSTINAVFSSQQTTNATEGYARAERLLIALHDSAPSLAPDISGWWGGVVTPVDKEIVFSQRGEFIDRLTLGMESGDSPIFSIYLSSLSGSKRKPNQLEITYFPGLGLLRIDIYRPSDALQVAKVLAAIPEAFPVNFAFVDVFDRKPMSDDPVEKASYRADFATFPHRQCLGWMAYVPQVVTEAELPLAAHIIPAKGGTIIVAVDEPFDLANKEHIKRANQIEMDMSDLGLLPVIDPSF